MMDKEVYAEYKSEQILKKYLPIIPNQLVHEIKQIKFKAFPLVLKIISPQALHKSDIHGVRIVHSKEELEKNFNDLLKISKKRRLRLEGILVQEYLNGYELIIGIKKDHTFGHVMMLGSGGIYAETVKDISIRACPVSLYDVESMIRDLRMKDILLGIRGEKINVSKLKKSLVRLSKLPSKYKNIEELDINPLIANKKGVFVADARMVFSKW